MSEFVSFADGIVRKDRVESASVVVTPDKKHVKRTIRMIGGHCFTTTTRIHHDPESDYKHFWDQMSQLLGITVERTGSASYEVRPLWQKIVPATICAAVVLLLIIR